MIITCSNFREEIVKQWPIKCTITCPIYIHRFSLKGKVAKIWGGCREYPYYHIEFKNDEIKYVFFKSGHDEEFELVWDERLPKDQYDLLRFCRSAWPANCKFNCPSINNIERTYKNPQDKIYLIYEDAVVVVTTKLNSTKYKFCIQEIVQVEMTSPGGIGYDSWTSLLCFRCGKSEVVYKDTFCQVCMEAVLDQAMNRLKSVESIPRRRIFCGD